MTTTLDCTIVPVEVRNIPEISVRIPSLHYQFYKWVTFFELCNSHSFFCGFLLYVFALYLPRSVSCGLRGLRTSSSAPRSVPCGVLQTPFFYPEPFHPVIVTSTGIPHIMSGVLI